MIKKLLVLFIILFCSGCYNYNELNDLAIAVAMGIDKEDNVYHISLEIVNTEKKEDENGNNNEFTIYSSSGETFEEALDNIYYICPKKIYLSHLEVIIYGEEAINSGFSGTLDYLGRNRELRENVLVFATENKASDILKATTNIESINALNILNTALATYSNLGTTKLLSFDELIDTYLNVNKEMVIPTITLEDNKIKMANIAIFKNNTKVANFDNNDILSYNILTNNIKQMNVKSSTISASINNINTNIIVKDNLKVDINIKAKGIITEIRDNYNLENNETINNINKIIASEIEENIKNTLNKIKKYNTDILGILDYYYQNKYKYYQKIYPNWYKKYFKNINYNINVDVNLFDKGKSNKVIYEK